MSVEGLESVVQTGRLPSPPQVALEVVNLCEDPDVRIEDLAEVIGRDAALTAKFLKTANSPLCRTASRVTQIDRALIVLGIGASRMLVLTFSLVGHYEQEQNTMIDYNRFWQRAVLNSMVAKHLAGEYFHEFADCAVVGGLLMDIGILALAECEPERYAKVWDLQSRSGNRLHLLEEEVLGTHHAEVGGYLLGRWNLPIPVTTAIRHHHDPETLPESHRALLPLVHILHLCELLGDVVMEVAAEETAPELLAFANERFGINREGLVQLVDMMSEKADDIAELLSSDEGPSLDAARLFSRARDLLFNIAWTGRQSGQTRAD